MGPTTSRYPNKHKKWDGRSFRRPDDTPTSAIPKPLDGDRLVEAVNETSHGSHEQFGALPGCLTDGNEQERAGAFAVDPCLARSNAV